MGILAKQNGDVCVCVSENGSHTPGQSNIEMENPGFFLRLPFIDIWLPKVTPQNDYILIWIMMTNQWRKNPQYPLAMFDLAMENIWKYHR